MDGLIVETMTLNDVESLAAEVKILDSMSEDNIPDNVVRSKVCMAVVCDARHACTSAEQARCNSSAQGVDVESCSLCEAHLCAIHRLARCCCCRLLSCCP